MYPLEMINTKQVPERKIDISIFFWHIIPHHFIMNFFPMKLNFYAKLSLKKSCVYCSPPIFFLLYFVFRGTHIRDLLAVNVMFILSDILHC